VDVDVYVVVVVVDPDPRSATVVGFLTWWARDLRWPPLANVGA